MAYKVIILYRLYMPSYFLGTFTEYPYLNRNHYLRMIAYNWKVVQVRKKMFCLSVAFS